GHWRIDTFISPLWQGRLEKRDTTARGGGRGGDARGASSPFRSWNETRNGIRDDNELERLARRLLAAPLDVVGDKNRRRDRRRAAVCAAHGNDCRDAAGT